MPYSLSLALASGLVVLAVTPLVMALARRIGAVDEPGPRRIHLEPVPTMGGLALVAAVLGVAWAARALPGPAATLDPRPLAGLTLAAVPIVALGIWDDTRRAGPWTKLAVQTLAGLVLVAYGYGIPILTNPFGEPIRLGVFDAPLTVAWVLVVVNAINLIDGLDGLAAGVVLIASTALWWVARGHADFYVMFFASLLIGAALGFLRYNFPPARIFMGDTGSQFLGLTFAALSLLENRKGTAAVTLLLPLVAMGVPIADSGFAFIRRALSGRHVFHADSEHIHHRLLRLGWSQRAVLFVLWGVCLVLATAAAALTLVPRRFALLLLAVLALGVFAAVEVLEAVGRRAEEREAGRRGPEGDGGR